MSEYAELLKISENFFYSRSFRCETDPMPFQIRTHRSIALNASTEAGQSGTRDKEKAMQR